MSEISDSPSEANGELNCLRDCAGVCCIDISIALTAGEAQHMIDGGSTIAIVLPVMTTPESLGAETENEVFSWADYLDEIRALGENEEPDITSFWERTAQEAEQLQPGEGLYTILGRCGFLLDDNSCGNYKDRPRICREFEAGSVVCRQFRQRLENPVAIEITQKPGT